MTEQRAALPFGFRLIPGDLRARGALDSAAILDKYIQDLDAHPSVQVPVSLIERAEAAKSDADAWRVVGDLLLCVPETAAALSQPTPNAETCICNTGPDTDGPDIDCHVHGLPPGIEDMAPGTTFTEEIRWTVTATSRPNILVAHSEHGGIRFLDQFDPSTIRDITPPKEHQ